MCEFARMIVALIAFPATEAIDVFSRRKHRIWTAKYEANRIARAERT